MSQHRIFEGDLSAQGLKLGIVVSRFNSFITERLLAGALDAVRRNGGDESAVDVAKVPGSLELPVVARQMAESKRYDAVICLGAVIRGETDHYGYVASEAARGVASLGAQTGVPVIFGVLTCHTLDQAVDRAGAKSGNAGFQAAMSAFETANLLRKMRDAS